MAILRNAMSADGTYNIGSVTVGNRTEKIDMIGFGSFVFQYTIAGIGTNVMVGIELSLDGINWGNADANDTWITKTENGTYLARFDGSTRYARFYLVSAVGGSPTISNIIIFGGAR